MDVVTAPAKIAPSCHEPEAVTTTPSSTAASRHDGMAASAAVVAGGCGTDSPAQRWRAGAFGLLAALGLLIFYLTIITLAQGWGHAVEQFATDAWFIGAIMGGFGTQIGLFTYLRSLHVHMATGGVATSTGTSTAAMLACCAHHLADILPIVGVSGAAIFLNAYKTPLLWLGIVMNLAGLAYLLWQLSKSRRHAAHAH
ncbi:MAG: hypothetical protein HY329_05085 [Chloroflexi bacterium]|nr:hypothetical protein [Chloroflexota bacterium]